MYKGEDLLIAMGAPGSRWSSSIRCIQSCVDFNCSDERPDWEYSNGNKGWHRGAYWGPYHAQGDNFRHMAVLNRDQVIHEFRKPFADWNTGIKVIKSHWFSYHIPQLREWFPDARFIAFYMPDDFCLDWWHQIGGYDIDYPHYDWYRLDDRNIKDQITIENAEILKYFQPEQKNLAQILEELGLSNRLHSDDFLIARDKKFADLSETLHKPISKIIQDTIYRTPVGIL